MMTWTLATTQNRNLWQFKKLYYTPLFHDDPFPTLRDILRKLWDEVGPDVLVIHDVIWLGKRREKSVVMEVGLPVEMTYTSYKDSKVKI